MRLAGTCTRYSKSAIPRLSSAAVYQGSRQIFQVHVPGKGHENIAPHKQQHRLQGKRDGLEHIHEKNITQTTLITRDRKKLCQFALAELYLNMTPALAGVETG